MPLYIEDSKLAPPIRVGIWKSRFLSLRKAINELEKELLKESDIDRKKIFKEFNKAMRTFGEKQFNYFYEGFGYEDEKPGFLEYSPEQPPEFVLRSILNQLTYDMSALEKAIKQRKNPEKAKALRQADVIAHRALEPVLGDKNLIKQDANVITYFQKVPGVLVTPYANVALIGIPYSALGENGAGASTSMRDYLSIPHEVGHYVYWRGVTSEGRLHVALRQRVVAIGLSSYENWLEEIFADVYGCLVGGEVMGLSAQDIHFDDLPSRLNEDNREHPAPVIRPVIYMLALNKLRGRENEGANGRDNFVGLLNRRWKKKLSYRGNPREFKLRHKLFDNPESKSVGLGRSDLKKIVEIIFDLLHIDSNGKAQFNSDWGGASESRNTLDDQAQLGQFDHEDQTVLEGVGQTAVKDEKGKPVQHNKLEEIIEPDDGKLEMVYANFVNKLTNKNESLSVQKFDDIFVEENKDVFSAPTSDDSWALRLREMKNPKQPASLWNVVFLADGWGPGSGDGDANTKGLEDNDD